MRLAIQSAIGSAFDPSMAFKGTLTQRIINMMAGRQGYVLDPSNLSTMFQDSAGTIPVTAVEQPVGKILDVSGNGNHFVQATSAKRPKLSARVNLLTKTEQFDDAVWVKSGMGVGSAPSVTPNAALAPDGTLTADQVTLAIGGSTSSSDWSWLYQNLLRTAGEPEKFAIWVKAATPADVGRAVVLIGSSSQGVTLSADWIRYELPALVTESVTYSYGVRLRGSETPGATDVSFHLWGAFLTLATDAHLPYQRVNTNTDYDSDPNKFPYYLSFDGVDDAMESAAVVPLSGSDKVMVGAGVTKFNDAIGSYLLQAGLPAALQNGSFVIMPSSFGASPDVRFEARGTISKSASGAHSAPVTMATLGIADIAAGLSLYSDGVQDMAITGSMGTGNFSNYTNYLFSTNGVLEYLSGRMYGILARGGASTPDERAIVTAWLASKQKRTL